MRQISEKVTGGAERLIEATTQWGAYLFDPSQEAGVGFLTIMGSGEVSVDGHAAGTAPIRHYRVRPGPIRVSWQQSDDRVERTVEAEAYAEIRVDPAVERQAPSAATPGPPIERNGTFARASVGVFLPLAVPGDTNEKGGSGFDILVEAGYTLPIRVSPFVMLANLSPRVKTSLDPESNGASLDFLSAGLGVAYTWPGAVLLAPSVALLYSKVDNHYCLPDGSGGCTESGSDPYPYGFGDSASSADIGLRVGYAVHRYFDVGARFDLFISKVDNGTLVSGSAGIMVGVP